MEKKVRCKKELKVTETDLVNGRRKVITSRRPSFEKKKYILQVK